MIPFKFFKGKIYTDEFTFPIVRRMLGRTLAQDFILPVQPITPPFGISNRHWNILPQDIRESTEEEMVAYIHGWYTTDVTDIMDRPYDDLRLGAVWYRGYAHRQSRITRREELQPTDQAYYHTDEFMFMDVTETRYDENTYVPYKVMLFRHIEEGNTVEGDRIDYTHPMWNFPDVI